MAFENRMLVLRDSVAYSFTDSTRFFDFASPDALATVLAAGYFNKARDDGRIKVGDVVSGIAGLGGTMVGFFGHFATVPATGNVTFVMDHDQPA